MSAEDLAKQGTRTLPNLNSLPVVPHICVIYTSVNRVSIGSGNGLSPVRQQASKPLPEPMLAYCQLNKLQWNLNQNKKNFIHENAFESVVCEMTAILSRGDELNWSSLCNEAHFAAAKKKDYSYRNIINPLSTSCVCILGKHISLSLYHHIF